MREWLRVFFSDCLWSDIEHLRLLINWEDRQMKRKISGHPTIFLNKANWETLMDMITINIYCSPIPGSIGQWYDFE